MLSELVLSILWKEIELAPGTIQLHGFGSGFGPIGQIDANNLQYCLIGMVEK